MIVGSSTSLWPWRRKPIRSTTTSLLKAKRYSIASCATRATASGSSPLTWKIGTGSRRATSEAKREECRALRLGGEADQVVDDHVHRAAHPVAVEVGHVQRLGEHPLAGEGGVAVEHDGEDLVVALVVPEPALLGAHPAERHRDRPPRDGSGSRPGGC